MAAGRVFLLALVLLAVACELRAQSAADRTLRHALAEYKLPADERVVRNLNKTITSGAVLDDGQQFLIAYYLDDGTSGLNPPLFLDRYDRRGKTWQSATLGDAKAKWQDIDVDCLGSVLNITAADQTLYLDTHINPSAGCLLVVSKDLKLQASLYGWLLSKLDDKHVVYRRSEIHFTPVHPAKIAIYDLGSNTDRTIFPMKPDPSIRAARVEQLRRFYDRHPDWCAQNNDPCDPEAFDSDLLGKVATKGGEGAVAFAISYEQIQDVSGEVQKPSGPEKVVYVYRHADDPQKMECREMGVDEVRAMFGEVGVEELVKPESLKIIFGK